MKIHIFYSHYNVTKTDYKNRPHWFDYEKCFINLLDTIKNKDNVILNVAMDGKVDDNWIGKYKESYNIYEFKGGNMEVVTKNIYKIIKDYQCDKNDLIYILENDYLHVNNWTEKVIDLFSTYNNLNYASLYDCIDKYTHPMYDDLVSKLVITETTHWKTTPSTCGSYVVPKKIILEDYDDQTGVTTPIGDHHKWLFLNETKNRFVLSPIPGLSTHCMEGLLSPTIDWKQINN
tara:strand:+ start:322 stop:1017 length:696 start_codon:yes stop_codon:yes gene_type:complete